MTTWDENIPKVLAWIVLWIIVLMVGRTIYEIGKAVAFHFKKRNK